MNAGALLFGGAAEHGQSTRLLFFIFIIFPRRAHVGFDREFLWNVFVAGLQHSGRFPVAAKGDIKTLQAHLGQGEVPQEGLCRTDVCRGAGGWEKGWSWGFVSWY